MVVKTIKAVILIATVMTFAGAPMSVSAQTPEDYFRGKTVRILIPGSPGAGSTLQVISLAGAFSKHIPGNPTVIPQYMPGAGGAAAINYLYNVTPTDPLTLAMPLAAVVIAQVTGDSSVKYDVTKMNWIGRINDLNRVFYVWHTVAAKSVLDLRSKPLVVGSTGRSSETFINPAIMNQLLGTKIKIVMGYKGAAAVTLAVEAGETEGASASWENIKSNHTAWLKDGKIRILAQIGLAKDPVLSEVPLLQELASNDADRALIEFMSSSSQVGNGLVAGPGVGAAMVEVLRTAFAKTLEDPEYLELARKRNIVVNHLSGPELTQLIGRTVSIAPDIVKRYKEVVRAQ